MEFMLLLLSIIVVVLVVQQRFFFTRKFEELEYGINRLQELVKESKPVKETDLRGVTKPTELVAGPPLQKPVAEPEPKRDAPKSMTDSFPPPQKKKEPEPVVIKRHHRPAHLPPRPLPNPEPRLSFFERHPDLEKFIGENLVNKIGIAILVLSIGYFVKYAIDSNWIGEIGRVAIGLICGAILIGFAHRMRNSYNAFSSVLVGGGLAVFYFTITLAFHQFHLFNQLTALIILVIITAFAVALSLLYNKQELAIIALVGGFLSPFMLSTGTENYNGLFLYILILNVGLLIIAYYKSWRILNITSFAFTVLVFTGVLLRLTTPTYHLGFIYASIFYLLYFIINIAYNVRENKRFIASDFSILLINTALYFSVGLYLLTEMKYEQHHGLFSASLGFVNLCLSYILFKNRKVDPNILYLLIGITLTFISLTAPIQLRGNHITLFWASEAVLLYWLHLKSEIKLIRSTSLIIWLAMVISLVMDWASIYSTNDALPILANKGFITTLFSAIATLSLSIFVKKDVNKEEKFGFHISDKILQIAAVIFLFMAGALEINHQFSARYQLSYLNINYLMLYVPAFVLLLDLVSGKLKFNYLSWESKLGLYVLSAIIYFFSTWSFFDLQREILEKAPFLGNHFIAHWISAILIAVVFSRIIRLCRNNMKGTALTNVTWLICGSIVLFLSLDLSLLSNMLFYSKANPLSEIQRVYIKTGLPVIWGLSSFVIMWLGMNYKDRILRIVSLSLFSLTLFKLFLFDIRNIPAAGKIVAFFCLGVLLLIVSFMYQKVKKIIIEDEKQVEV
jgi:uncharacterized membrane protein